MSNRSIRESERDARLKVLELARECVSSNLSARGMALKHNLNLHLLAQGTMILRHGTPEQIEKMESCNISWSKLYHEIVSHLSPEERKTMRSNSMRRPRPEQFQDGRLRAIAAADEVIATGISYNDAAAKHGITRSFVEDAYLVLTRASPEQIERVRSGKVGLFNIGREVRQAKGETRVPRKKSVLSSSSKEQLAFEAVIWDRLKTALTNLRDLPAPADVVAVARKNHMRRTTIDELLMNSFSWITEFADAWTK